MRLPLLFLPKGDNLMNFIEPTSIKTVTPTEQLADRVQLLEEQLCILTTMFLDLQLTTLTDDSSKLQRLELIAQNKDLKDNMRKRYYNKQTASK